MLCEQHILFAAVKELMANKLPIQSDVKPKVCLVKTSRCTRYSLHREYVKTNSYATVMILGHNRFIYIFVKFCIPIAKLTLYICHTGRLLQHQI